jgi:hypothetical protein
MSLPSATWVCRISRQHNEQCRPNYEVLLSKVNTAIVAYKIGPARNSTHFGMRTILLGIPTFKMIILHRIRPMRILVPMKLTIPVLCLLGLSTSVALADVCSSSTLARDLESINKIRPKGWDTSIRPTERVVGIPDKTPACEILLRDSRPESAIKENSSKHSGEGVKIAPSFFLWFIERTSPDRLEAITEALSHRPPQVQMAYPEILGSNTRYIVLILGSAGTTWPDAEKKIRHALSLPTSKDVARDEE